jgi:Sensors of blue-light using FAD
LITTRYGDEAGRLERPLYNVVYCSRASAGVDAAVVDAIITTARRFNAANGITGMLVFGSGVFMQWLEGPRDNVTALMAMIVSDPRHHHVVQLSDSEEVRERLFPDWDMELVDADHIREVLLDARDSATDPRNAASLDRMLAELPA